MARRTLQSDEKPFLLSRWESRECAECDAQEMGMNNRVDHGCMFEVEIAAHRTLKSARMHGGRVAKDGTPVAVYGEDGDCVWSL